MRSGQEQPRCGAVPFSVHPIWGYVTLTCLLVGEANLDYLVKVVYAGFLHCKVTVFPFVINKYLAGRYFETVQISFFSYSHQLILLSTNDACQ